MGIKNTEHLFEIPWNNDPALLEAIKPYRDKISCVFLPCAVNHGMCTENNIGTDVESVKQSIELIQHAGFNPCVLMQRNFKTEFFSFYKDLGVKYYTVGEDATAEFIREKLGNDAYLIASLTKDLVNEDYEIYAENKPSLYDVFILHFRYSRDIESIMNLPKSLKYGLTANLMCLWNCKAYRTHWFCQSESYIDIDVRKYACHKQRGNGVDVDLDKVNYIKPEDIWLFDPYFETYKITHRKSPTISIVGNLKKYIEADVSTPDDKTIQETICRYNIGHNKAERMGDPIY